MKLARWSFVQRALKISATTLECDFTNYGKNSSIAKDNILVMQDILTEYGIPHWLVCGSLLGAIREKGIIAHDHDTDLAIFHTEKHKLCLALPKLEKHGFSLIRVDRDAQDDILISFGRNNEYIDFYLMRRVIFWPFILLPGSGFFHNSFFNGSEQTEFCGRQFAIPNNAIKLLEKWYGKNWIIPMENQPGMHPYLPFFIKVTYPAFDRVSRYLITY